MYRILGVDGRQYGPVSAEQLRRWIAEGRANAQTQVHVEGSSEWKSLGTLPEFASAFTPQSPPPFTTPGGTPWRRTNAYALWGMICGLVGLLSCCCCCLSLPCGALGLIFSLIGLSEINQHPDIYQGRGVAIAGIVLSTLSLLIGICMLFSDMSNGHFHHYHHFNIQHF